MTTEKEQYDRWFDKPTPAAVDQPPGTVKAQDDLQTLVRLVHKASRILLLIEREGVPLSDPENILAIQAISVLIAMAMGADPRESSERVIEIVQGLDIDLEYIRGLLKA